MGQSDDAIVIEHLTTGPFQVNVYVVGCVRSGRGVIIDAGGDPSGLERLARERDLELEAIWQTHAHIDHVGALSEIKARRPELPIVIHPDERPIYEAAPRQGEYFGIPLGPLPPPDRWLRDGETLELGELRAEVMLCPGHSPGSVMFRFAEQGVAIGGDVLFRGSMGRVDLPGSDANAMRRTLKRVAALPPETVVWPGHGPSTTISEELRTNPFLRGDW